MKVDSQEFKELQTVGTATAEKPKMQMTDVTVHYADKQAIYDVSLEIGENEVVSLIGPSGCGKSTFLRCLNRMNDTIDICRVGGKLLLDGEDIYDKNLDPVLLRARVGMVFQKPNPFPKSIYDNVAYGPRLHGLFKNKEELDHIVENSLQKAGLWKEVSDRLSSPGTGLSGGQQQRLCIARTIAVSPEVILMDEPCSALDPIATRQVEELMIELKEHYSVALVTHNMQQATRVADVTAFLGVDISQGGRTGYLVEMDETQKIFEDPQQELTKQYVKGEFS